MHAWLSITCSADGQVLAAGSDGGYVSTSTDGGLSWAVEQSTGSRAWYGMASSADGSLLVASDYGGYVYTASSVSPTHSPSISPQDDPESSNSGDNGGLSDSAVVGLSVSFSIAGAVLIFVFGLYIYRKFFVKSRDRTKLDELKDDLMFI